MSKSYVNHILKSSRNKELTYEEKLNKLEYLIKSYHFQKKFVKMAKFYHPINKDVTILVLIGEYGSHTNGKNIQLSIQHKYIEKYTLEEIYNVFIKGVFIHELEHNISSNFEEFTLFITEVSEYFVENYKVSKSFGQKIGVAFMNGTEDGRIERIAGERVPAYELLIRQRNLMIWESQPLPEQHDELGIFLHNIVCYAVSGLYQNKFTDFYDENHEVRILLEKLKPLIDKIKYTNKAKEVRPLCWEMLKIAEPYLAKKIAEGKEKAEQSLKDMPEQPDFSAGAGEDFEPGGEGQGQKQEPQQSQNGPINDDDFLEDDKKKKNQQNGKNGEESKGQGQEEGEEGQGQEGNESSSGNKKDKDGNEKDSSKGDKDGNDGKDDENGEEGSSKGDKGDKGDENGEEGSSKGDKGDKGDESDEESGEEGDKSKNKDGKGEGEESDADNDSDTSNSENKSKRNNEVKEQKNKKNAFDMEGDSVIDLTASEVEKLIQEEIEANRQRIIDEGSKEISTIQNAQKKQEKQEEKENGPVLEKKEVDKIIEKHYKEDSYKDYKQIRRKNFAGFVNEKVPSYLLVEAKKYKRIFEAMLKETTAPLRGLDQGRLDARDVYKIVTGSKAIFTQIQAPKQSTAVSFALDGSGSMYGYPERQVRSMMAVFEEIFIKLCSLNIQIFSTMGNSTVHHVVKEWDEPLKQDYNYSWNGLHARSASGGNKDGYSIRMMAKELELRPETRKILFVLSDGLPSCYRGGSHVGMADVKHAVKEARKKGIIVVPIMFGDAHFLEDNKEAFKEMYGKHIIAVEREQILPRLVKVMKKLLV